MKKKLLVTMLLILTITSFSQNKSTMNFDNSCSFNNTPITDDIYEFSSSSEAKKTILNIVSVVGLKPNFEIVASNVPNAVAVIDKGKRYIYYSENFIENIKKGTGTKWASISVIAHEIGHHLNGHTLDNIGSRPSTELEADEFSGFALKKMGASLEEAQAGMKHIGNDKGSLTHPPKSARLEAIAVGWKKADSEVKSKTETSTSSETKPIFRRAKKQPTQTSTRNTERHINSKGDLCITNKSSKFLKLNVVVANKHNNLNHSNQYAARIKLNPSATKCFYDIPAKPHFYYVFDINRKSSYSPSYDEGYIKIEKGKITNYNIN